MQATSQVLRNSAAAEAHILAVPLVEKDFATMSTEHITTKRKPKNWCGTQISHNSNESDPTPINNIMPAFPIGQRFYPCVTQDGRMPTLGMPPDLSSGKHGGGDSIMVGMKTLVPRWVASTENPTKLLYFVVKDGFSDDDFKYVLLPSR